ncbi:hypothetical protein GCM10007094_41460 [Pseudovibrio japonicus]|uniref:Pyridine nucleotide transhydrogenase n=1 Tax=Pseudovibrio japonicus TaxID=366534 RepID=A0ABQ3EUP7_9HYPH|nr:NAD(P)-dependent oxidoreductase [Pseudovibrio japonicus]GHB47858.1 hypothetical protein GCM10007094_41460 [Pseudovibrio japonicus]
MKSRALLGYTGYVGSTLRQSNHYTAVFNSTNIQSIDGKEFDQIIIAAAPAEKWRANQHSVADLLNIEKLIGHLKQVSARQAVLISTVDVYPDPIGVNETNQIDADQNHPYGRHRLLLEREVAGLFATKIIRLPGLFGNGLKKNIIFDYLNDNQIEKIDTRSQFQFYNMARLAYDIERIVENDHMSVVNLTVEPVKAAQVSLACTGREHKNHPLKAPPRYDVKSIYAEQFGGRNGYFYSANECLTDIAAFSKVQRENA